MAVPMMSLYVAPQFAAAVMMPILLAMDVLIVWQYRQTWDKPIIYGLLPAAFVGLILGGISFQYLQADMIRFLIGLLAAFFVLNFLISKQGGKPRETSSRLVVFGLGALSGFASFIAHAGGPPVKGYLLQQKLEKSWFVGTNTVYFFSLNFLKTLAYGAFGSLSFTSLEISVYLVPVLLLGVLMGFRLHHLIDQNHFVLVVYGFLSLTSAKLLYDSSMSIFFQ